ncbi:protease pro-enzyme activation domain-containing protein [Terriglobus sp. RCC_193]|uniref:protease pro-enzyme activation domain-containing protein n=1 Tax=Terriglobus sp. RCC_193 TaxID=3239218 RepID=UPI0035260E81
MTHASAFPRRFRSVIAAVVLFAAAVFPALAAGQVARRLYSLPSSSDPRVSLPATVSPRVKTASVLGHLGGETQLTGMSLVLKPTDAQAAALQQLLVDQQNPSSPQYHKWLTPQTFGEQFGLSDADLSIVKDWLSSKGFTVDEVAPSRNRIVFSGTASAVESAFTTTLQRFHRADQDYFENSTAISLPQSLAGVVSGITGISSYHIQPIQKSPLVSPLYTATSGSHYLVPWDFRQIFGMNTLISQGYDGTGIKIGVIGQSSVTSAQLTYFQQLTGQTQKLPTMVLVPNTGSSGQLSASDEQESELDLEYASGSAPGAQVLFIYTGTSTATTNNGVFTAMIYAITNNLAPILTLSYGACENEASSYATTVLEPVLAQASSQGQTILVSSGDWGPTACETPNSAGVVAVAQGGLSVSYPASSPNVTAVGGTTLTGTTSQYWSSPNNSYGGSAVGYIPETAWNDSAVVGSLSASGGGASAIFGKPSWQAGTGVLSDAHRDVPDVAFPSSAQTNGYLVCVVGTYQCTNGSTFGNSSGAWIYGGTSAAAPNFAAMLAIVEQATGNTGGLGNINTKLYTLAAGSSSTSVFHDITTGNNAVTCKGGTTGCSSTSASASGTMGYSAGTGYDMVTGLGSLDASGLATALKSSTGTSGKLTPTVSLSAGNSTPAGGTTDLLTVTVGGSGSTPTGSVVLSIDGTSVTTFTSAASSNTYTYTVPACTTTTASTCIHSATALYAGDTNYYSASSTINLTVTSTATVTSIALTPAASTLTVTSGSTGTDVLTIASTGFAGTVSFKVSTTASLTGCYSLPSATVAANASATSTLTLYTSSASCASASATSVSSKFASSSLPAHGPWQRGGVAVLAAGFVGAFFLRKRIRPVTLLLVLLSAAAIGLSGCGGSSSTTSTSGTTAAKGSYPLTITATGVPSNGAASITATTTVTLVVQ